MRFIDVHSWWKANVSDAIVFRGSRLDRIMDEDAANKYQCVLLADSAYLCLRYLMTPIADGKIQRKVFLDKERIMRVCRNFLAGTNDNPQTHEYSLTCTFSAKSPAEQAYNAAHSATWGVMERAQRRWKKRFPALESGLDTRSEILDSVSISRVAPSGLLEDNKS